MARQQRWFRAGSTVGGLRRAAAVGVVAARGESAAAVTRNPAGLEMEAALRLTAGQMATFQQQGPGRRAARPTRAVGSVAAASGRSVRAHSGVETARQSDGRGSRADGEVERGGRVATQTATTAESGTPRRRGGDDDAAAAAAAGEKVEPKTKLQFWVRCVHGSGAKVTSSEA